MAGLAAFNLFTVTFTRRKILKFKTAILVFQDINEF